jgi:cyclophilin family peptidyl-prolyl cis-trans isomerase
MNNKILIITILLLVVAILYFNFNLVSSQPILNKEIILDKKENEDIKEESNLENQMIEDDEDDEDEIHSEDITNMFNLSEENPEEVEESDGKNIAYLDIDVNNNRGRILISLNNKVTPKTAKNFSVLCEKKAYVNSPFHRVINNFMIQGGDFTNYDGTGGISIYGNTFKDENFDLKNVRGTISMANSGPNTNGSQFFISTNDNNFLDGKHVVFGKVIKGMDLVDYIETLETDENDRPLNEIKVVDSGLL